ncbi:hypothetical protein [Roseomonas elaeocarpi]|uniref:Uncharacterized protein n=1 Tax=Roseomonas elaeocarpi TaxID=907779 RepID=A0ABV6JXP5_9PROT
MTPDLRPVRVDTGSSDEEGRLVFVADRLVAVLVQLSDQHGEMAGHWFLEHGFGGVGGPKRPTFASLQAAEHWICHRLGEE